MSDQPPPSEDGQQAERTAPSQISGQAKWAQGTLYNAIGSVIPEAAGSSSWLESGAELQRDGQTEINNAKTEAAASATVDAASAKLKTAAGYLTGDQSRQTEGNLENEKAQWEYKQATHSGILSGIPIPSAEGVQGKVESVVGMMTGDQEKQREGNLRAEKAAWRDGV